MELKNRYFEAIDVKLNENGRKRGNKNIKNSKLFIWVQWIQANRKTKY